VNNWIKDVYPDLSRGVVLASEPNVAGIEKQALFEGIMVERVWLEGKSYATQL
jgi:hypothetical protein